MWDVFARLRLVALGLGVLAAGSVVEASVISFKAVKKNDLAITPTNNLAVLGGDKIEVELFLSGWASDFPSPSRIRAFQVKISRLGFVSNDNGTAKPLGWCGPVDKISCTTSPECLAANPAYPICLTSQPVGCTCSPHNPDLGGDITTTRADFLLFGLDGTQPTCVTTFIEYIYFGVADFESVQDTGVPRYLGTLVLTVSANACGTFTIGSVQEAENTFIVDTAANSFMPASQPLVLTVSNCSRQLLSCSPGHCNIDARIAHDRLNQNTKKNTNQVVMTFNKSTTSPNMTAADFEVTLVPYQPAANCTGAGVPYACCEGAGVGVCDIIPTISLLAPNPGNSNITTLTLNRRIQQTRWTCIREKGSNKRCCMGSLPADADNSRISQPDDVFEVLDNLQGGIVIPALAIEKCDIDRSGLPCSPADLLMVVDLLTGADAFDPVWNSVTGGNSLPALVPECPMMTMPP